MVLSLLWLDFPFTLGLRKLVVVLLVPRYHDGLSVFTKHQHQPVGHHPVDDEVEDGEEEEGHEAGHQAVGHPHVEHGVFHLGGTHDNIWS